jgi:hypothetical protein
MAPLKSTLSKSVAKLLGVYRDRDLSLRGFTQSIRVPNSKVTASGGNLSDALAPGNGYKYHTFSTPGNFTVTEGVGVLGIVEVLVVAGGGSGASTNVAGGAGAGGVVLATSYAVTPGAYPVSVGGGGNSPAMSGDNPTRGGVPGSDSYFGPSGERLTAKGGAGGGNSYIGGVAAKSGGSGAGGGWYNTGYPLGSATEATPGPATQPSQSHPGAPGTITNYGNAGGSGGGNNPNNGIGGGGGGAGDAGDSNPFPSPGGNASHGGDGQPFPDFAYPLAFPGPVASALGPNSPNNSHYAGGGGGGRHIAGSQGSQPGPTTGGVGGGGRGGNGNGITPTPGVDYLGGGSGDGNGYVQAGNGGDGIVIIRYLV